MTALPFNATREALSRVREYQRARNTGVVPQLSLALGLSAILEGVKLARDGRAEPGLRLIEEGAAHLRQFLPKMDARVAAEIGVAADNLRRKAGAA